MIIRYITFLSYRKTSQNKLFKTMNLRYFDKEQDANVEYRMLEFLLLAENREHLPLNYPKNPISRRFFD